MSSFVESPMNNLDQSYEAAVAIIGMALRFPDASTPAQFWHNLRTGVESIVTLSDEELLAAGVSPATLSDPRYVRCASPLEGVERFDASFFGVSPREAALMDPQQRVFLESAWEALESGGYGGAGRMGGSVGVFAGAGLNRYLVENLLPALDGFEEGSGTQAWLGNERDFLATRVAYKLDLHGPALTVSTACSTSLVALHLACQSLLAGECDAALAGAVSLRLPHRVGYWYQPGGPLSPDGHCRAFDRHASGTIFGSGAGVLLLKPLERAMADGDHIRAVIRGTAINNDGARKVGYTAPSVTGQAAVIAEALAVAGVKPEEV
ncbi:MAG: polyketide synthase, partial [Pyrinomonadaceae bacterium]